ncbi:ArsR family transcriptional regulator [Cryobacterium roopkundense]|uniref:ArsR family transcriptional regulator n=1 Tax=Cryobacterium roopkundense TaxID=1001240 RepID=A0A099J254_9MICO|nr:metalloregulator ArsR/SmtB family transcription factor [Cryobacterium roopkundense]KGJ72529.1 ArsR family transcriptional regulator [Cryobacterium roopkundense]MBB5642628.1 ArsR family transcriptional regulator [Cryobacterium roopkundense]
MTFDVVPLTDVTDGAGADAVLCCSPLVQESIAPEQADTLARQLKALADPSRLRIISIVAAHSDAEACVCDLTEQLELSQPTISHHLKVLVDGGFLTRSKRGTWSYYRLVPGSLDSVAGVLATV